MILLCNQKKLHGINRSVFLEFKQTKVYYKICGKKRRGTNIFLHGWGQSGASFYDFAENFDDHRNIFVDFPPFGKSGNPKDFTIFTYCELVIALCEHLKIDKCNLIAHSFGGRVAILVSSLRADLVEKLILIDSAGMKPRRPLSYYVNVCCYKILKAMGAPSKKAGSQDYKKLDTNMKKTFVNIVNTHLEEYCPFIQASTLIIFGKDDKETPVYMAKRLKKLIKNSKLCVLSHAGHFAYIDRKMAVFSLIDRFLKEEA